MTTTDTGPTRGSAPRAAVVTGGSGGIGSAIARRLATQGLTVAVVDMDERAHAVAEEVGGFAVVGDLTAPDFPVRVVQRTLDACGSLGVMGTKPC